MPLNLLPRQMSLLPRMGHSSEPQLRGLIAGTGLDRNRGQGGQPLGLCSHRIVGRGQIVQALPHGNSPKPIVPQARKPGVQPLDAETSHGPQIKSASNIVAFIAARQAGQSLQEAAEQYGLTEDEALAISISYRDATPASANNNAMS